MTIRFYGTVTSVWDGLELLPSIEPGDPFSGGIVYDDSIAAVPGLDTDLYRYAVWNFDLIPEAGFSLILGGQQLLFTNASDPDAPLTIEASDTESLPGVFNASWIGKRPMSENQRLSGFKENEILIQNAQLDSSFSLFPRPEVVSLPLPITPTSLWYLAGYDFDTQRGSAIIGTLWSFTVPEPPSINLEILAAAMLVYRSRRAPTRWRLILPTKRQARHASHCDEDTR